ncbi:preprotein translocase subunit SecG [Candidatus Dependentiae bacterium]|nr:preprotein translocase subunit SecG [Candidatus Dependentiae bacterium]
MLQKSKSSAGMGGIGGNVQMLFGGSGGQDLFQKITWTLAIIFMGGSLMLAIMKTRQAETSRYLSKIVIPAQQMPMAPITTSAPTEGSTENQ